MFSIGEVARRIGVRPSAIRFYEGKGLFRPATRRDNGYRVYDENDIKILLFAVRARTLGITLTEIKSLLRLDGGEEL